ncbi:356_t:CDS:1, partial [Acaulospora colombiana]
MTNSSLNLVRLWRSTFELTVGEISRYRIRFDKSKHPFNTAWPPVELVLKVTNSTSIIFRGAFFSGPYYISASCIQTDHHRARPHSELLPHAKGCIKCGESWEIKLEIPPSGIGDWTIDILSEIIFTSTKVKYDLGIFAAMPKNAMTKDKKIFDNAFLISEDGTTTTFSPSISYEFMRPRDVIKTPDLSELATRDIHLVVLTHGIHGSTLDELFIKEAIEE